MPLSPVGWGNILAWITAATLAFDRWKIGTALQTLTAASEALRTALRAHEEAEDLRFEKIDEWFDDLLLRSAGRCA